MIHGFKVRAVPFSDFRSEGSTTAQLDCAEDGSIAVIRCLFKAEALGGRSFQEVAVFNLNSGEELPWSKQRKDRSAGSISLTSDGQQLLVRLEGKLAILDTRSGDEICQAPYNGPIMVFARFGKDHNHFVTAGESNTVLVWEVHANKIRIAHRLTGEVDLELPAASTCADLSADGNLVVAGSTDTFVRVWDLREKGK